MSRRNKKAFGGTRQLSAWLRLQVTFLSLSLEEFDFIPAKLLQSLITVSSPIFSLSKVMLGLNPKLLAGIGAMYHSIIDGCKCFTLKGSHLQQFWQFHTMASILWALLRRPTDQLKREHNVQPLKHPSDGLVWSQESVIILKNKRSWIDMLTSFSWWEAGKVGFYLCQPREDLVSFVHLNPFYGADVDHTQYG